MLSSLAGWWENWGKGLSHNMSGRDLMKQGPNPDSGAKAHKHHAALPHHWTVDCGPLLVSPPAVNIALLHAQSLACLPLLPAHFAALSVNILLHPPPPLPAFQHEPAAPQSICRFLVIILWIYSEFTKLLDLLTTEARSWSEQRHIVFLKDK